MKIGDLVSLIMKETSPPQEPQLGIITDVVYGFTDASFEKQVPTQVKVFWQKHNCESRWICPTKFHEVLSEMQR
tara:strand:+ start:1291 stop:1512 length:222 start_codon:yes stop_codon:yes gene_type:complete